MLTLYWQYTSLYICLCSNDKLYLDFSSLKKELAERNETIQMYQEMTAVKDQIVVSLTNQVLMCNDDSIYISLPWEKKNDSFVLNFIYSVALGGRGGGVRRVWANLFIPRWFLLKMLETHLPSFKIGKLPEGARRELGPSVFNILHRTIIVCTSHCKIFELKNIDTRCALNSTVREWARSTSCKLTPLTKYRFPDGYKHALNSVCSLVGSQVE